MPHNGTPTRHDLLERHEPESPPLNREWRQDPDRDPGGVGVTHVSGTNCHRCVGTLTQQNESAARGATDGWPLARAASCRPRPP